MASLSTSLVVFVVFIAAAYSQDATAVTDGVLTTVAGCRGQGLHNCSSCENPGLTCTQCPPTYRPKADKLGCEKCPDKCETCRERATGDVCTKCVTRYHLDSTTTCVECPQDCLTCTAGGAGTDPICTECTAGFVANKTCIACPANCDECPSKDGVATCTKCKSSGFVLNSAAPADPFKACLACPGTCATCSGTEKTGTTDSQCATCGDGYNYKTGACEKCTTDCKKCTSTASTDCTECNAEHYVSSGQCAACPFKCSKCSGSSSVAGQPACSECVSGYGRKDPYPETCDPCPANCATCTLEGVCSRCKDAFNFNAAQQCVACSTNCLSCTLSGSTWTCNTCKQLYKPSGATCYQCPAGCSDAKCEYDAGLSGAKCTMCDLQTGKTVDDSTGKCIDCPTNCEACSYNSTSQEFTCTACKDYFGLGDTADCTSCGGGCKDCEYNSSSQAMQCVCIDRPAAGTHYPADPDPNTPTSYFGVCTSGGLTANACDDGYWYDKDNLVCTSCDLVGCHVCAGRRDQCAQCQDGYAGPDKNAFTCQSCFDVNCATCKNNFQKCQTCKDRYVVDKTTKACVACVDSNCLVCKISGNSQTCTSCVTGYFRDANDACSKTPEGCIDLRHKSDSCKACASKYVLDSEKCYACPGDCAVCSFDTNTNSATCTQCDAKFALSTSGTCSACPADCAECGFIGSVVKCTTCNSLFGLTEGLLCQACPFKCQACGYNAGVDNMQCTQCSDDYVINARQCGVCPANCLSCVSSATGMSCSSCKQGFYIDPTTKQCTACGLLCTKCSSASCSECTSGYGFTAAKPDCTACADLTGIAQCSQCDGAKCTACISGYVINAENKCTSGAVGTCVTWEDKGWQCTECTIEGQVALSDGSCGYKCYSCPVTVNGTACTDASCECNNTESIASNMAECSFGTCMTTWTSTKGLFLTTKNVLTRGCGSADICATERSCVDEGSGVERCEGCCIGSQCNDKNQASSIRGAMIEQTLWMILFAVQVSLW